MIKLDNASIDNCLWSIEIVETCVTSDPAKIMHDMINQTKCMSQQEIILVIQTLLQLLDFT